MNRTVFRSGTGLALVLAGFVALSLLVSFGLRGVKLDLTEGRLYTLSEGTRQVLASVESPLTLTLYFSQKATADLPALRTYATRVQELLREYADQGRGQLRVEVVDPEPFSEQEDAATAAGLQGVPAGLRGDKVFFGLVGQNAAGDEAIIPFFQMDREPWLEYELTKLIQTLNNPEKPVVGIISGLQVNGGFDFARGGQTPPWAVIQQLEGLFEIRWLDSKVEQIEGLDVLLLIHPSDLSEATMLAIDQYALGGGKLIAFLDPHAESVDASMGSLMPAARRSDLAPLLKRWGVSLRDEFVGDYARSMMVSLSGQRAPVRHVGLLGLDASAFAAQDVILDGLNNLNLSTAGTFALDELVEGLQAQVLLESSTESMLKDASQLQMMMSPEALLEGFEPQGVAYPLALRIQGRVGTAFPEGVTVRTPVESTTEVSVEAQASPAEPEYTMREIKPGVQEGALNVLLIGDTDLLTNRLWVQVADFFGEQIVTPWADNGSLLVNALDHYAGSEALISIRSRGRFTRPFEKVEGLRRAAETRWLEQQQTLQQRLAETESQLAELEQMRGADDNALLTPEQQQALLNFQKEKLDIRRALRDVQHQLDQDIEALGARVKFVNILIMPMLLTLLLAGIYLIWRRYTHR